MFVLLSHLMLTLSSTCSEVCSHNLLYNRYQFCTWYFLSLIFSHCCLAKKPIAIFFLMLLQARTSLNSFDGSWSLASGSRFQLLLKMVKCTTVLTLFGFAYVEEKTGESTICPINSSLLCQKWKSKPNYFQTYFLVPFCGIEAESATVRNERNMFSSPHVQLEPASGLFFLSGHIFPSWFQMAH